MKIAKSTENYHREQPNTKFGSSPRDPIPPELEAIYPTAKEIFDKPLVPLEDFPPLPAAWTADTTARERADKECVRRIVNADFDPPITEREIVRHARRFKLSERESELEIREGRHARL